MGFEFGCLMIWNHILIFFKEIYFYIQKKILIYMNTFNILTIIIISLINYHIFRKQS